jgi:hypothetical protein
MYILVGAIARPIGGGGRWTTIALGEMLLPTVFSTYDRVLVTLANNFLTGLHCLDLADIREAYGSQDITFNAFLVLNGAGTLPTTVGAPLLNTRYAEYNDAFVAKYKVRSVHPSASPDTDLPASEKTWLLLSKPHVNYNLAYESFLVSVNGFIHATDASSDGLYVKEGMVSRQLSGKAEIGLYSFRKLGKLAFIPITDSMVYKQDPAQRFKDRAHVDLGVDVSGKTVMLVLGGYLHVLDERTFYRVSDSAFAVVFNNLPLIERFYDSRKYLDLSSMAVEISTDNPSHFAVDDLFSDAALLAYLTLSQSFFVVLDNPNIFVERKLIQSSKLPGQYMTDVAPVFPLTDEIGKMANFSYQYETGQYSITVTDAYRHDYNFRTVESRTALSLGDNRNPTRPLANSDLQYLQIGADL